MPLIKEIGIDSKDLISKLEEEIPRRVAISDLSKLNRDLGKLIPKMKEKIKKHHRMYSRFEDKEFEWLDVDIFSESDRGGAPPVLPESSMSEVRQKLLRKYQVGDL